jgi:putative redox protein
MAIHPKVTVVQSESGYAQTIESGGHTLTADEPTSVPGGTDTGPAPYGLLLASLGACTSITLRMYAERKGWSLGRIEVQLRHLKVPDAPDGKQDRIERTLRFSAPLTDEQRKRLGEIAEKTPVTVTLKSGASIETRVE